MSESLWRRYRKWDKAGAEAIWGKETQEKAKGLSNTLNRIAVVSFKVAAMAFVAAVLVIVYASL